MFFSYATRWSVTYSPAEVDHKCGVSVNSLDRTSPVFLKVRLTDKLVDLEENRFFFIMS